METLVDRQFARSTVPTDLATLGYLLNTLALFALGMSLAMLVIDLASAPDTLILNDFLYAIGTACILPLTFLAVSVLISTIYIGVVMLEPVMLSAWRQSCRIKVVVQTFLLHRLWTLVYRIAIICLAFLIDERVPYRDPDEAAGLRKFDNPDISSRFIHRWVAGSSPHILYD